MMEVFYPEGEGTLYWACILVVLGYTLCGWLIPLGVKINYGRLK